MSVIGTAGFGNNIHPCHSSSNPVSQPFLTMNGIRRRGVLSVESPIQRKSGL